MEHFKSLPLKTKVQCVMLRRICDFKNQTMLISNLPLALLEDEPNTHHYSGENAKQKAILDLQNWLPDIIDYAAPDLTNDWGNGLVNLVEDPTCFHVQILKHQVENHAFQLPFIKEHSDEVIIITDEIIDQISNEIINHFSIKITTNK